MFYTINPDTKKQVLTKNSLKSIFDHYKDDDLEWYPPNVRLVYNNDNEFIGTVYLNPFRFEPAEPIIFNKIEMSLVII